MDYSKRCYTKINLDNLNYNLNKIKSQVPAQTKVLGIVKANAYGHGDKVIVGALEKSGVDYYGVSNVLEGQSVRKTGTKKPILILGHTSVSEAFLLYKYDITQAVYSIEYAQKLNNALEKLGGSINIHIKIDTGMNRIGFKGTKDEICNEVMKLQQYKNLKITGIFTHLCVSDVYTPENTDFTLKQYNLFLSVCDSLTQHGMDIGIRHISNSGAIFNYPELTLDMIRPGIVLYGLDPADILKNPLGLKPVMSLYSTVAFVKYIYEGDTVGYGRHYTCHGVRKIATVTIGYADGYPRLLSNKAKVIVHGKLCDIVGNICMDQIMVDVTDVDEVFEDDVVTIVGCEGDVSVTFTDLANTIGTINYELTCGINRRVPRVYIENGKEVFAKDYYSEFEN